MRERIKTLLISANGTHPVSVATETITRGVLGIRGAAPAWIDRHPTLRQLFGARYASAWYLNDWHDAFTSHPTLRTDTCNITNLLELRALRTKVAQYELIVVLHSAAGDRMTLLSHAARWFPARPGKLAVFIGNEYDLLSDKIRFINTSRADYVCTQLPLAAARRLYEGCTGELLAVPHALNADLYRRIPEIDPGIDIGFAGDLYDRLIGDRERTALVEYFSRGERTAGLTCDIRAVRMPRDEWIRFLNRCHGVIGAESGTYYLHDRGEALNCARRHLRRRPGATFGEVYESCFATASRALSGKAISSRHFEPVGTRTCQLLIEGEYNGILQAEVHYIAIRKDLSNIDEALRRFKDKEYRDRIADCAYRHVLSAHTYRHRVDDLIITMFGGAVPACEPVS